MLAPNCYETCGNPIMTIRASMPTIKTPMVVTDKATHLYSKKKPSEFFGEKSAN
jgi:hypothetical protein